jgi:D-alanyl-D-alanine dipeptidase
VQRLASIGLFACLLVAVAALAQARRELIDVTTVVPDIALEIRYFTDHNFVGRPIVGYRAPKCLLTREAAAALARVQQRLRRLDLSLKAYDCYRPQAAVDDFVAWARDPADQTMKAEFYPSVDKQNLFEDGYLAARSGHSRGSTVDVTIVPRTRAAPPPFDAAAPLRSCESSQELRYPDDSLDMGTGYDCFSPRSHAASPLVGAEQRANRLLLATLMEANGFVQLPEEWWHFTLAEEPYPDTYFDFPVQ